MTIVRPTATAIVDNVRPAGSDVFIEARDVVKTYDTGRLQVEALRGVDLTINRGEHAAPNGADVADCDRPYAEHADNFCGAIDRRHRGLQH